MPRGAMTIAETRQEAENQVLAGGAPVRILRTRELDLSGLPPLAGGPLPKHWVVVVEHADPAVEATLEQHEDPEEHCERATRQMYLALATDPELLVTGSIEQFSCPACGADIRLDRPPPRERPDPGHADCPKCGKHLVRREDGLAWEVFQPPARQSRECIFCGAAANSMEHVIPAWVARRLGLEAFLVPDDPPPRGAVGRRSQPVSFASYRARIFCRSCNRHFKHLEDAVIPLLVPMARARILSLGAESQEQLALWAAKTAMAITAAQPDLPNSVPVEHRRLIRQEGRLPDEICCSYFAWNGDPVMSTWQGRVTSPRPPHGDHRAYTASLAFGRVGFHVVGLLEPPRPNEALDGNRPPMLQFWPPSHQLINWPPPLSANERLFSGLSESVSLRHKDSRDV